MDSRRIALFWVTGLLALQASLWAQGGFRPLTDLQLFGSSTYEFREAGTTLEDVKGSPFLEEEFRMGRIMINQSMYEEVSLRYDVYSDRFQVRLTETTLVIDPARNNIDTLYYGGYRFVRKFLLPGKNQTLSHVAVLYQDDRCTLYKRFIMNLVPATKASAYVEARPAAFNPGPPEYYLGRGGDLVQFKGVKSFAGFYGVEPGQVRSLVKERQLNLQDEGDLVRLCAAFSR